ncbi:methylated-DNA--[protein]-cysteine S-methyltransferase [Microvirgula aerodenitrificans]|uniref:methylated-DNA--[protein]-cysteine S-methyltransferase n=1 Tax=Microvirgula aerodenitrificans TaxID=57480 RepID=UPI00248E4413|nr:methylated-DNA--[protein]-cysteine S-methyltransferase [Microvirgula aerodenitrificans]
MNPPAFPSPRLHFRHQPISGTLRHAMGRCALGTVLVARSDRGLCAILLDDQPDALPAQLAGIFPGTCLEPAPLHGELERVTALIDTGVCDPALDLDVGGTPFQQRVWQMLCTIPVGQTVTYTDVAQRIGAPAAVRAVASACAANVFAIAIPCHRVLRRDGLLTGYRWGIERKRAQLQRERGGD